MSVTVTPAVGVKAFFEKEQIIPTDKASLLKYLAYSKFVELFLALMYGDATSDSDLKRYMIFSHCTDEQIKKYKEVRQEFQEWNSRWKYSSLVLNAASTVYAKVKAFSDNRTSVYPLGNSLSPKHLPWASVYMRNETFLSYLQKVLHIVYADLELWKLPFEESPYMYTVKGVKPWLWLTSDSQICTSKDLTMENPIEEGCIPISMYSMNSSVLYMMGSELHVAEIIEHPSIDEDFNVVYTTNKGNILQNDLLIFNKSYFAFNQMLDSIEKGGILQDEEESFNLLCTGFKYDQIIDFSIVNKTMK